MGSQWEDKSKPHLNIVFVGHVDHGKSTTVGRLLLDSGHIEQHVIEKFEQEASERGKAGFGFAYVMDGLKEERERGITIDVAHKEFFTPKYYFTVIDAPGHRDFVKNMITGTSQADAAVLNVAANDGVNAQTKEHAFLAKVLGVKELIVNINKMDISGVDWSEDKYKSAVEEVSNLLKMAGFNPADVPKIPCSSFNGENLFNKSDNMPWYKGGTLLYTLENVFIGNEFNHVDARFPVQWVIRPQSKEHHDFRGFAGRVAGGVFKKGDEVTVQPSGFRSRVKAIHTFEGEVDEAFAPMSVTMTLEDEIDISRGDMIVKQNNPPLVSQDLDAMICWFSESTKLQLGRKYTIRHTTREAKCVIKEAKYKVNVNTLHKVEDDLEVGLNDIARISLRTSAPLLHDPYKRNRQTGSFIIVDDATNATVAAGMIV